MFHLKSMPEKLIFAFILLFAVIITDRAVEMGMSGDKIVFITGAFIVSQSFTRIRWFQRKMNPELKELTVRDVEKFFHEKI